MSRDIVHLHIFYLYINAFFFCLLFLVFLSSIFVIFLLDRSAILKYLHDRYKLNEQYYPQSDQKRKEKVDDILDNWGKCSYGTILSAVTHDPPKTDIFPKTIFFNFPGLGNHVVDALKHGIFFVFCYFLCCFFLEVATQYPSFDRLLL